MAAPALHHRVDGSGPNVVLLHPVGLDLTCFDPLVADLGQRFTVLRVDLRGHGRSPFQAATDLGGYADDVQALLAGMAWPPAAIVGFSFGGMVAQELALRHPGRVRALVIAACASTFAADVRPLIAARGAVALQEGMAAVVEPTLARWFSPSFRASGGDAPTRARLLANDVHGWAAAWTAMAGLDTAPRLHEIAAPTLCLAAEQDLSAPPPILEAIAARIPGARLEVLPDAPHMLFIEQPAAVAAALSRFLDAAL
jgi:3-oxoadipate enol-lactonase